MWFLAGVFDMDLKSLVSVLQRSLWLLCHDRIIYRNHIDTQAGSFCPNCLLLSFPQASGIWEWVSRSLLCSRVRGDKGLMPCHKRRAVFLSEMERESIFVPTFSMWDNSQRGKADFQLTQANVPDKVEEHFHFVFQLIFNCVQAK